MKIQISKAQFKRLINEQIEGSLKETNQKYLGQCDRIRQKEGGEEFWQEMMRNKKEISKSRFLSIINPTEILDDDEETIDDFFADDVITFWQSKVYGRQIYFIATSGTNGFEFIWETEDPIQSELDAIIAKYDSMGMACWIYYRKDSEAIEIASIKIKDKAQRRQGLGSQLMAQITALCDKYSLLCVLSPDSSETPMAALQRFYKGFGFTANKGRNKDFRFKQSMIRNPQ